MKFAKILIISVFIVEVLCAPADVNTCGQRHAIHGTAFGGERSTPGEWPWLVALIHNHYLSLFCAGTLISEKHVLSAAHCFHEKRNYELLQPGNVTAIVGKHDLSIDNELGSKKHSILDIIIHQDWNQNETSYDADISLLFLFESVTFNDNVQPICLPEPSIEDVVGNGSVVGWGYSEHSRISADKLPNKIIVPAISSTRCYLKFPALAKVASFRTFCAGYENLERGPCRGDSGGGFYLRDSSHWAIRGIVSSSLIDRDRECDVNKYSIYTNVGKFVYWIRNLMEDGRNVAINYVRFECSKGILPFDTVCKYKDYKEYNKQHRIHPDFSLHTNRLIKSAQDVTNLQLDLSSMSGMYLGLGEVFIFLEILKISGFVRFFERRHFEYLGKLKQLNLEETFGFETLPENVFWDLWKLEELQIKTSNLESLPENIFSTLKNLKKLYFIENRLKELKKEIFTQIPQLEKLKVQEKLAFNDENTPWDLPNLKSLDFFKCFFEILPENFFTKMENLERLTLSQNKFSQLQPNLFDSLKKLKVLNLNNNPLKQLHASSFMNLLSLEVLNLDNCKLESFPDGIFSNAKNLRELYANKNQLKRLEANLFKNNENLKKIEFADNKLEVINVDFEYLKGLTSFTMLGNECTNFTYDKSLQDNFVFFQGTMVMMNCNENLVDYEDHKQYIFTMLSRLQFENHVGIAELVKIIMETPYRTLEQKFAKELKAGNLDNIFV